MTIGNSVEVDVPGQAVEKEGGYTFQNVMIVSLGSLGSDDLLNPLLLSRRKQWILKCEGQQEGITQ